MRARGNGVHRLYYDGRTRATGTTVPRLRRRKWARFPRLPPTSGPLTTRPTLTPLTVRFTATPVVEAKGLTRCACIAGTLTVRAGDQHWTNTEAGVPFTLGVWADHDAVVQVVASDEVQVRSDGDGGVRAPASCCRLLVTSHGACWWNRARGRLCRSYDWESRAPTTWLRVVQRLSFSYC